MRNSGGQKWTVERSGDRILIRIDRSLTIAQALRLAQAILDAIDTRQEG